MSVLETVTIDVPQLSGGRERARALVDRARLLIPGGEVVIDCRQTRVVSGEFAVALLISVSACGPKQISVQNVATAEMAMAWTKAALDAGVLLADIALAFRPYSLTFNAALGTMTVAQLREVLAGHPDDMLVTMDCDEGVVYAIKTVNVEARDGREYLSLSVQEP